MRKTIFGGLLLGTVYGALALSGCVSNDNAAPNGGNDGGAKQDSSVTPFDGSTAHDGAIDDASTGTDAPPDSPVLGCDPNKPFGTPTLAPYDHGAFDDIAARLSQDELTMYVQSNRNGANGFGAIFTLTRATTADTFTNATLLTSANLPGVNTANEKPTITADGKTLYTDSLDFDDAAAPQQLWVFTRASATGPFTTTAKVNISTPAQADVDPFVTADGTQLYFTSTRTADSSLGAFVASLQADGGFATPTELTELDVAGTVTGNLLPSADGLTIYFFSNRDINDAASTSNDIYVARRASTSDPFGAPTRITELATTANDEPDWLSPDGCTLWFTTGGIGEADGGDGHSHIYQATRPQ